MIDPHPLPAVAEIRLIWDPSNATYQYLRARDELWLCEGEAGGRCVVTKFHGQATSVRKFWFRSKVLGINWNSKYFIISQSSLQQSIHTQRWSCRPGPGYDDVGMWDGAFNDFLLFYEPHLNQQMAHEGSAMWHEPCLNSTYKTNTAGGTRIFGAKNPTRNTTSLPTKRLRPDSDWSEHVCSRA